MRQSGDPEVPIERPASTAPTVPATHATIPLEVTETEGSVVVRARLPGVQAEDVKVSVQGDMLTMSAARRPSRADESVLGEPRLAAHPQAALFEGVAALPVPVRALEAQAAVDGESVTVTLPKADSEQEADVTRQDELRAEQLAAAQQNHERDEVTKESEASFPASDPPSWTRERT